MKFPHIHYVMLIVKIMSFKACYGSSNEANVSRVKNIYEELRIPHVFRNYEEESYLDIQTHIDQVSLKTHSPKFYIS